jgi:hypothetical protein
LIAETIEVGIVVVVVVQEQILVFFRSLRNFLAVFVDEEADLELRLSQSRGGRRME